MEINPKEKKERYTMTHRRPEKIFLIINKYAGHKQGEKAVSHVVPFLKRKGCLVSYAFTNHPGHASELAEMAVADGFDLVVAVGGDGTVNEVAQGLIGSPTTLGILPMGSGNGLARELGISMNLNRSARTLLEGETLNLDVCKLNGQQFLCTSGIGFDALVADQMSKAASRGFLKYVQLVVKESISFKPFAVRMWLDGRLVETPVFLVTFANASQFGNNAFIAPGASMNDGLIDVVVVKPFNKLWLPVFSLALFARLVPRLPFVDCFKARAIDLEVAETQVFHFDGEPGKLKVPAQIRLNASKILVRCANRF